MKGRVLIIAGSDSGGGAGIQADIKAVTCLGGFAMSAITALTAQNTQGVSGIHDVPEDFIKEQMRVVLDDLGADCIKTGMLGKSSAIHAICEGLEAWATDVPLVVDPVMVAKGGASLLAKDAIATLKERLIPKAFLLTPNVPEAEVLSGREIKDSSDMIAAAEEIFKLGPQAVLMKGGHLEDTGGMVYDYLLTQNGINEIFSSPRIETRHTHGTGCTTASALACSLAQGMDLIGATRRSRDYVHQAIASAPGFGKGHGPLNHAHTVAD